jgi:hypothetical protein
VEYLKRIATYCNPAENHPPNTDRRVWNRVRHVDQEDSKNTGKNLCIGFYWYVVMLDISWFGICDHLPYTMKPSPSLHPRDFSIVIGGAQITQYILDDGDGTYCEVAELLALLCEQPCRASMPSIACS